MHIVILIIVIFILYFISRSTNNSPSDDSQQTLHSNEYSNNYYKTRILTDTEADFYPVLKTIADRYSFFLFSKVRFADIVRAKGSDNKEYMKYFGKIKSKHLDFVLCDAAFNTVAVIELDDKTHSKKRNHENDLVKNGILEAVGIPIVRVFVSFNYDIDDIEKQILIASGIAPDSDNSSDSSHPSEAAALPPSPEAQGSDNG